MTEIQPLPFVSYTAYSTLINDAAFSALSALHAQPLSAKYTTPNAPTTTGAVVRRGAGSDGKKADQRTMSAETVRPGSIADEVPYGEAVCDEGVLLIYERW